MQDNIKIQVNNLYKIFGKDPDKAYQHIKDGLSREQIMNKTGNIVGLRNVSFSIKEGDIFVIMGLSGSGKSTLLRCINRLHNPTYGEVIINNEDITKISNNKLRQLRKEEFGMVFQSFALFSNRTVIENVVFGLEIKGVGKKERFKEGEKALESVGLKGWEHKPISSLSGGMQQRVGLARALATNPKILFMDEPFSALDPLIRVKMQEELLLLQKDMKKTILFVTHDLNEAMRVGDKIGIMNSEGEMIQIGSPEQIIFEPVNDYVKEFIQDVDIPSVIRSESLFEPTNNYIESDVSIDYIDSYFKNHGIDHVFVTTHGKYEGVVLKEDLEHSSNKSLKAQEVCRNIKGTFKLSPIKNILPVVIGYGIPAPVIDEEGNFEGEIPKESLTNILQRI